MNNAESDFAKELQRVTHETRLRTQQKQEMERERKEALERVAKERAENKLNKEISELEDWALSRAKKGRDWFRIRALDTEKDIDPLSWRNINFDYSRLTSSMIRGEKKRIIDYFEKKGLRIIFGEYRGEHDYHDPDHYFIAATWGDHKTIVSSLGSDTGERNDVKDQYDRGWGN